MIFNDTIVNKFICHTPPPKKKIKYISRLEENVSRVVGQNSLIPQERNNLNFTMRLTCDQLVLLEICFHSTSMFP